MAGPRSRREFAGRIIRYALRDLCSALARFRFPAMGFGSGLVAFLGGFGLTYILERDDVTAPSEPVLAGTVTRTGPDYAFEYSVSVDPGGELPGALTYAVWQYHALHGVGVTALSFDRSAVFTPAPSVALYFVPLVFLCLAGFCFVSVAGEDSLVRSGIRGAAPALGYFPAAVWTSSSAVWETELEVGDAPWLVDFGVETSGAALGTGLVYPAFFGAIGGFLAFYYHFETAETDGT